VDFIHIKNLEKYNPGYKDRNLIWCKIYFSMLNSDPEFEMLCEIDKWRFMAFIMLELQTKKPVPLDEGYLKRKGFDFKKRPMYLTLKMLHNFLEHVTQNGKVVYPREEKRREEKNRIDKSEVCTKTSDNNPDVKTFLTFFSDEFKKRNNTAYGIDWGKDGKIVKGLLKIYSLTELKEIVLKYFDSTDDFILQAGHSIGVFKACINKVISQKQKKNVHGIIMGE
jgi:hypothetical protein